jgi:hypothetical protein
MKSLQLSTLDSTQWGPSKSHRMSATGRHLTIYAVKACPFVGPIVRF